MRVKIASSLLILGSLFGCYVQPANPPPATYGQAPPPEAPPTANPYPQQPTYAPPPEQPAPPPAPAAPPSPPTYSGPVYDNYNGNVVGSSVPSVDVFYNDLQPYGSWYQDPTYGWVFAPPSPNYLPYSNGHWAYTDYGNTWVSADPFGWATDHYGRWVWANRWVWRPDTTWGPAWVQWRQGDGYVGWAPAGYSDDAYFPEDHWRIVPVTYLFASDTPRYVIRSNVRPYLSTTFVVRRYGHDRHNHTWVLGPDDEWLRRNRVEVRRERVDAYALGRFDEQRRRDAEARAHERQREWDARRRRDDQVRRDLEARQRRQDDERRRLADEHRRIEDQRRRQQDEQRRLADEQRRLDEQRQRAANDAERRRLEAEHKRLEDQQRKLA